MRKLFGIHKDKKGLKSLEEELDRVREIGDSLTVAVLPSDAEPDGWREELQELIDSYELEVEIEEITDHPGGNLVELSEQGGYDEIILSGMGRSPMDKIRIDDTAEFVLLNSRVNVKIIR